MMAGTDTLPAERHVAGDERLVDVGVEHSAAMRALFGRAFGHEMSAAHWHWKYVQGGGAGVGLLRDGRMVAHYGGVPRRVTYLGRPALACQVCDVMVDRSANRALVRRGPLYRVAARFLDAQVGDGRPHPVAFGFPSARHHAVAQRLGLYGKVDEFVRVAWPAALASSKPRAALEPIGGAGAGFDAAERRIVDGLARRMTGALSDTVVGVRDAQWIAYRFLSHPTSRYDVLLLRQGWWRRPLGIVVLRQHETRLDLLDLVAAPQAWPEMVQAARMHARALGLPQVEAWITASQLARLVADGDDAASVTDLQIPLPHIVHTPGPSADEQRGHWLLMGGDADFT